MPVTPEELARRKIDRLLEANTHAARGVAIQSSNYSKFLPQTLPAWRRPLPFAYESTGN